MREESTISSFIKYSRKKNRLTQASLAMKAGVGLRFIRDLEQGKESLQMDKVNQVLSLFGSKLIPGPGRMQDPYKILLNNMNKPVSIYLKNKNVLKGFIVEAVNTDLRIEAWKFVPDYKIKEYRKTHDSSLEQTIAHREIDQIENN